MIIMIYKGFDRLMSILCKASSIRDVIAFPKTAGGTDLLFQSPARVDGSVLGPYGLKSIGANPTAVAAEGDMVEQVKSA
jgi:aspartyl-tRNA synthetase